MNGGYLMVSKSDTNLYAKLNNALTVGKPILWYEDETTCYYIDTITKSGTDIILTKGGKTITIEDDGDINETGNIQPQEKHLYQHTISLDRTGYHITFNVITNDKTSITIDTLPLLKGYTTIATGIQQTGPSVYGVYGNVTIDETELVFEGCHINDGSVNSATQAYATVTLTDTVTQII